MEMGYFANSPMLWIIKGNELPGFWVQNTDELEASLMDDLMTMAETSMTIAIITFDTDQCMEIWPTACIRITAPIRMFPIPFTPIREESIWRIGDKGRTR
ncbi:hypothetical protein D3C73_1490990 [compost metagenome]